MTDSSKLRTKIERMDDLVMNDLATISDRDLMSEARAIAESW